MECNWGTGSKKPLVYYPHPSMADHAIQGFPRSDLMNIHVNEAIQLEKLKIRHEIISLHREIEKEQIRQEILAAETARRRELVVEVMKEMAMEREMAKGMQLTYSPSPFENRWFHQQSTYSPPYLETHRFHQQSTYSSSSFENQWYHQQLATANQTRTIVHIDMSPTFAVPAGSKVKPSKDKLIVLDKPSQDRVGAQCTAVAPPAGGSGKLIVIGKRPKEEWSCALCRVSAANERGWNEHLQGKKHKAKEAALRAEINAEKAGSSKWKKNTCFKLAEAKGLKKANEVGQTSKSTSEYSDTTTGSNTDAKASAVMVLLSDDSQGLKREDATGQKDADRDILPFWKVKKDDKTTQEAKREKLMVDGAEGENTTVEKGSGDHAGMDETAADPIAVEPKIKSPVSEKAKKDVLVKEIKEEAKGGVTLEYKKKVEFCCDICGGRTYSEKVMEAHFQGKWHKAQLQKQSEYSEVVPTATISLSDALKESGLQNAALEEAKMENPTAENSIKVDITSQEAIVENPMVEIETVENPLVEANQDNPIMEKVRADDPKADEPRDCNVADEAEEGMEMENIKAKAEETISEHKKKFEFWCYLCNIGAVSQTVMEAHFQGKKHRAKITRRSECYETILTATTLPPKAHQEATGENPVVEMEIVENPMVTKASWEQSMVEKVRAENPTADEDRGEGRNAANEVDEGMLAEEIKSKAEDIISERKKTFDFWCDICTIGTNSQEVMEAHLQGRRHKARTQRQNNHSEAVPTSTVSTIQESLLQKEALEEEAEMENSTAENSMIVDRTAQEAREENPMVEVEIVENRLVEEATREDSMVEKRRAEDPAVDEPQGDHPTTTISSSDTLKESILQNAASMEKPTNEDSIKMNLPTPEANGENLVVEVEILEDPLRAEDPVADEPREECNVTNIVEEIEAKAEETISERKKKFDFWCEICTIGTFSQVVMEGHLQGKKHRSKFQKRCEAILNATMLPPIAPQEAQLKHPKAEEGRGNETIAA